MIKTILKGVAAFGLAALSLGAMAGSANAQSLLEKAEKGEPIRIGFANEIPFAYPGDDGSPKGFVNAFNTTADWGSEPPFGSRAKSPRGCKRSIRPDSSTATSNRKTCRSTQAAEPSCSISDSLIVSTKSDRSRTRVSCSAR